MFIIKAFSVWWDDYGVLFSPCWAEWSRAFGYSFDAIMLIIYSVNVSAYCVRTVMLVTVSMLSCINNSMTSIVNYFSISVSMMSSTMLPSFSASVIMNSDVIQSVVITFITMIPFIHNPMATSINDLFITSMSLMSMLLLQILWLLIILELSHRDLLLMLSFIHNLGWLGECLLDWLLELLYIIIKSQVVKTVTLALQKLFVFVMMRLFMTFTSFLLS